ncbi:PREDICTED: LOC109946780, partial [Prunus dulcis]
EIPTEVIAESIAVAQKQQEIPRAELTSLELALFEDAEAEHSTAILAPEEQAKQSVSEPVDQAEQMVAVPEPEVKVAAAVSDLMVEVPSIAGVLAVVTSLLKPPIVA